MNLELEHGLKIESMDEESGVQLIANLEDSDTFTTLAKISGDIPCVNHSEKKIYFITKELRADKIMDPEVSQFSNKIVHEYLTPTLRLTRLFKKGNITMPSSYYYYSDIVPPKASMRTFTWIHVARELFSLGEDTVELQNFLKEIKLPFKESFLQLALQNFESSYDLPFRHLSFLLSMMSLEIMFNNGSTELAYRIRRNVAVLLGKDIPDSELIYNNVKKLYQKRSDLVHNGVADISEDDLITLRHYVRESIKKISRLGKNKLDLLNLLNSSGFGNRIES